MSRRLAVAVMAAVALGAAPAVGCAAPVFSPRAPGIGDAYFPFEGNGGYDARHYTLDVAYEPATDRLTGVATMSATATQDLSRFDLDFTGLTVRSIRVDGRAASWTRAGQELVITPAKGLRKGANFTVVTAYDGVPQTIGDSSIGVSGFLHTHDGALVAGQPDVAATWLPVNDHPRDKARYTLHITVPEGLQAIANGLPR